MSNAMIRNAVIRNAMRAGLLASVLSAPLAAQAQVMWTAASTQQTAAIQGAGRPWTLNDGTPFNGYVNNGGTTPGATKYWSTTGLATPSVMAPFYQFYITGSGSNLQGYFDYRPAGINEATVTANSTDAGRTWNFQQKVLQLTPLLPVLTDDNAAFGNDAGLGHPHVMNIAGASWLYLLDRRNGHDGLDQLVVKRLAVKAGKPVGTQNATAQVSPVTGAGAATLLAQWSFNSLTVATNNSPAADAGSVTAAAKTLGMTNSYTYPSNQGGTGGVQTSSTAADDIEAASPGGSDPVSPASNNKDWRIRGNKGLANPNAGNGWNNSAPQYSQGAEFDIDTTGKTNIVFQYDWFVTGSGVRNLQAQYTTDKTAATPVWTSAGPLQTTVDGGGFVNNITIDFGALGITSVENNAKFGVRLVSAFDPSTGGTTYSGASLTNGAATQYNNFSGNWHFDNVKVYSKTNVSDADLPDYTTSTTGLIAPDGILAEVPNTSPRKILYISKKLGVDFSLVANTQQCTSAMLSPLSVAASKASQPQNHDYVQVRIATTADGVHFTDLGAVSGLNDPTTTSATGLRYIGPGGSIVKLAGGRFGLFFSAGNCLDGDSDAFHIIGYAETTGTNPNAWTVVNGMMNPIASVTPVTIQPVAATGTTGSNGLATATVIPAAAPVIGSTQSWYAGRVYSAMAIKVNPNLVTLVFDGYDFGYKQKTNPDFISYRTVGQIFLSSGTASLQ